MKFSRILLIAAALIQGLCIVSCKDKDEDETLPYLTGDPQFELPLYGKPGDTFNFTASGVKDDDGNAPSYYWSASPVKTKRDTSLTYTLTLPDTLCNVTVTCGAFKKGYYGTTTSKKISIISSKREGGSLSGIVFDPEKDFKYTDPRDGHEYWCTTIGDKDWFKDNLAYTAAGKPLENSEVTSELFGMFYSWEEAIESCPDGWRVTTLNDWADAAKAVTGKDFGIGEHMYDIAGDFMGDVYFNGEKMWSYWPDVKITATSGLYLLPLGFANLTEEGKAVFESMNGYAAFWTADEKDAEQAYYRYIYEEQPDILLGSASKKSFAASVRCVRDHE